MKRLRCEEGQTLIFVALSMTCLLGFVALAVDGGLLFREKRLVQIAADSAAVAGAAELNYGDASSAAAADAAQNGFTNGVNGATVSVHYPPLNGPNSANGDYVEVIVSQNQPTTFMGLFKFGTVKVSARGVATTAPINNCVYTIGTTGTDISMSNAAQLDTELNSSGCGIIDDSSSSSAVSVQGGAKITAASIGVVGGSSTGNGGTVSPTPTTGITPVTNPLAYLQPPSYNAAQCGSDPLTPLWSGWQFLCRGAGSTYSTTQNGDLVCYSSLTLGSNGDTVTINPGIYVITGALTFNSGKNLGGDGVTFYFTGSGSINIGNGATINLSARPAGPITEFSSISPRVTPRRRIWREARVRF